jgi:hypothetical protein
MDGNWRNYTPAERIRNTIALADDVPKLKQIRSELMTAMVTGQRFSSFLKGRGLDPAAWEGLVAGLRKGKLVD